VRFGKIDGRTDVGTRFRRVSNVVLAGALVVGGLTAGAAVAQAAPVAPTSPLVPFKPFDCHWDTAPESGWATCFQGGGEHRVKVRCDKNNWPDYDAYGPWKPNGQYSWATCDYGDDSKSASVQTRQST
jgi:hypothetical protein